MKLARSSFYYVVKEGSPVKKEDEVGLRDRIETICAEFPRYGYRRVTAQLRRESRPVNHKKVLRLMRESDLLCRVKRRWVNTTDSNHPFRRYPNLIKGMVIDRLNQVWLADITYIHISAGFVYLAAIIDAYSRRVIGYAVSRRLDVELSLSALQMAIKERGLYPGTIHHSDQGVQYAATEYVASLENQGFRVSMSRTGNPYDNAEMESFFKTLKYEEVYLSEYETMKDVLERLPIFIEEVYNHKRLHSALGYIPPNEFEEMLVRKYNLVSPRHSLLTQPVHS
jgi:transposase InsO family protein